MAKKKTKAEPPKAKVGRPLIFDERNRNILCGAIAKGMPIRLACDLIQISYETYKRTRQTTPEFRAQVLQSKALRVNTWLDCFTKAIGKGEWRAAQYLMKVTHPEYFAERDPEAVTRAELTNLMQSLSSRIRDALPKKYHGLIDAALFAPTQESNASRKQKT